MRLFRLSTLVLLIASDLSAQSIFDQLSGSYVNRAALDLEQEMANLEAKERAEQVAEKQRRALYAEYKLALFRIATGQASDEDYALVEQFQTIGFNQHDLSGTPGPKKDAREYAAGTQGHQFGGSTPGSSRSTSPTHSARNPAAPAPLKTHLKYREADDDDQQLINSLLDGRSPPSVLGDSNEFCTAYYRIIRLRSTGGEQYALIDENTEIAYLLDPSGTVMTVQDDNNGRPATLVVTTPENAAWTTLAFLTASGKLREKIDMENRAKGRASRALPSPTQAKIDAANALAAKLLQEEAEEKKRSNQRRLAAKNANKKPKVSQSAAASAPPPASDAPKVERPKRFNLRELRELQALERKLWIPAVPAPAPAKCIAPGAAKELLRKNPVGWLLFCLTVLSRSDISDERRLAVSTWLAKYQ